MKREKSPGDSRFQRSDRGHTVSVTATEAQNEFGRILDTVAQDRVVIITRHNTPKAVLMSLERFDALSRTEDVTLDTLSAEFDALLAGMQTEESRAGMRRAFDASPEELGRAAVEAAQNRSG